jgi:hypothetical protein
MRFVIALAACLFAAPAFAQAISVHGHVQHPANFTMAQLRAMPQIDVKIDQKTEKGPFAGTFHGVLLWDLVNKAGLINGPRRHAILRHAILVSARADQYATIVSLGEIHPELGNGQVILATEQDGQPLAQPRLIIPGDAKAAREVRNVTDVEVQ